MDSLLKTLMWMMKLIFILLQLLFFPGDLLPNGIVMLWMKLAEILVELSLFPGNLLSKRVVVAAPMLDGTHLAIVIVVDGCVVVGGTVIDGNRSGTKCGRRATDGDWSALDVSSGATANGRGTSKRMRVLVLLQWRLIAIAVIATVKIVNFFIISSDSFAIGVRAIRIIVIVIVVQIIVIVVIVVIIQQIII